MRKLFYILIHAKQGCQNVIYGVETSYSANVTAESIEPKSVVSGHSFSSYNGGFGLVEAETRKKQNTNVPGNWKETILNARRKYPKFDVIEVKNTDFVSIAALEQSITNRKKDTEGAYFS